VQDDEPAIGRRVDVDFQHVGTEPQRPLIRVHRVRRRLVLAALVRDVDLPERRPVGLRRRGRIREEEEGRGQGHRPEARASRLAAVT